jgi:hypothetical protein
MPSLKEYKPVIHLSPPREQIVRSVAGSIGMMVGLTTCVDWYQPGNKNVLHILGRIVGTIVSLVVIVLILLVGI